MKSRSKIAIKCVLSLLYVLLIVITIISIVRNGFAYTASGVKIPDTWLYVPLGVFLLITIIQALCFHIVKEKYGISGLCLSFIKLIAVYLVDLRNDYYLFIFGHSIDGVWFHNEKIWNMILVVLFLCVTLTVAIIEIIGAIQIIKSSSEKT